ncbi:MAG: hypothetical protein QXQ81_09845, partial [Candidatus Thorarchaeota archaeon]
ACLAKGCSSAIPLTTGGAHTRPVVSSTQIGGARGAVGDRVAEMPFGEFRELASCEVMLKLVGSQT